MAGPKALTHYEEVSERVAHGAAVKDAVVQVAEQFGVTAGTVQTNYYRVMRERGEGLAGRRSTTPAAGQSSDELLRVAFDALEALAKRAEAQEKDLERLRRIESALNDR